MAIDPIQSGGIGKPGPATGGPAAASGPDFRRFLVDNLNKVNEMQQEAGKAVEDLVTGQETDITRVMGAVEKADVAFQTLMAVRNKLIDAYQEILRMRI